MIVSQFIKFVYAYPDCTSEMELNVSFDEFKTLTAKWENGGNERATAFPIEK